ncbi:MAG: magnesium transporter [Actinomycetota bacterium]|nr:magnesium transporter [Actinomycetota bacterium]
MEDRNRVLGESLGDLLSQGKMAAALALLDGLQPADAAEVLESLPYEDRLRIFRAWDVEESSEALPEMSEEGQVEVLQGLARGLATRIIAEMPPDDAVDLLADLPPGTAEALLSGMSPDKAGQLRRLMAHGEETAGGLMTPEAMRLSDTLAVGEVLDSLREVPENIEMVYYVYYQDMEGRLSGVNSLRELIIADPETPVAEIMHRNLITVGPEEDQEKVAALIDRYDLLAVPVVDGEGRMLGIVTVDDVMDVIEEEAKEDIYSLAGTWEAEEGRERNPFLAAVIGRLPWVIIALALELLVAGGLLRAYSATMRAHIALVFFIPAILSMGSTVSLQSATRMTVEVLGGGEGGRRFAASALNELLIGLGIAAASGTLISLFARSVGDSARLGMVVGIAMACTVLFAALVGSVLPLLLKALRGDPAKASEPFLATLMDILGLAVYLLIGMALI